MTFKIEVTWQVTWQVLILTSTFTFFQVLLHYIDNATGLSRKTLLPPERMWLGRCIPTYWYVRNSGYLTYLQIVYLSKRDVYYLWAPWLVVRLRSRLDAIGLLPLWWDVSFFMG